MGLIINRAQNNPCTILENRICKAKVAFNSIRYNYNHHLTIWYMSFLPTEIRGLFGEKGDSKNWLDATSQFPNGVPRFQSKDECISFMTEYNTHHGGSNPDQPYLMHIFTMLTSFSFNWKLYNM